MAQARTQKGNANFGGKKHSIKSRQEISNRLKEQHEKDGVRTWLIKQGRLYTGHPNPNAGRKKRTEK